MALAELLRGETLYLDANIFIYTVEGYPRYAPAMRELSDLMESGDVRAITSELTLAEVLVKPIADGDRDLRRTYEDALQTSEGLLVLPVTRAILVRAAGVRARAASIRLADAIHVATAHVTRCHSLLTNDTLLKGATGLKVLILSEIISA